MKTLLTLLFPLFIFGQSEIGYLFISENTIPLEQTLKEGIVVKSNKIIKRGF
jgi:hypothetical protein